MRDLDLYVATANAMPAEARVALERFTRLNQVILSAVNTWTDRPQ